MTTETNNHQTQQIVGITVIGSLGVIGLIAIFMIEEHPEHAMIYAGLLATMLTSVIGFILTVGKLKTIVGETKQLVVQTNSRMTELLEAAEKLAYAAGVKSEKVLQENGIKAPDRTEQDHHV